MNRQERRAMLKECGKNQQCRDGWKRASAMYAQYGPDVMRQVSQRVIAELQRRAMR
jgi:hypothetical protein